MIGRQSRAASGVFRKRIRVLLRSPVPVAQINSRILSGVLAMFTLPVTYDAAFGPPPPCLQTAGVSATLKNCMNRLGLLISLFLITVCILASEHFAVSYWHTVGLF